MLKSAEIFGGLSKSFDILDSFTKCTTANYTRKNLTTCSKLSLQTSRQQVVFARLVTTCQQVWNKLLTTGNNLVDIVRLVTKLFQQGCYNHDTTILLQPCVVNLVPNLLQQTRNKQSEHNFFDNLWTDLLLLVCRLVTTCAFLRVYNILRVCKVILSNFYTLII